MFFFKYKVYVLKNAGTAVIGPTAEAQSGHIINSWT